MWRTLMFATGLLLFASMAVGQSVEKARLLRTNKMLDDAKREAVAVVFSDASDNEKASALNLLGDIAVDQADYDAAIKNWRDLVATYPGSESAGEAKAKLPLAEKLAASGAGRPVAPEIQDASGAVIIAGVAPEHPEYADQAVLEFMNFLGSQGVKTTNSFPGRLSDATQGRVAQVALPNLLDQARKAGANGVLYVYIHFKGMENMRVECYSAAGKKLWQEKVAASLGASPSGMTESFVRRMKGKLVKHVGGPCLPRQIEAP